MTIRYEIILMAGASTPSVMDLISTFSMLEIDWKRYVAS